MALRGYQLPSNPHRGGGGGGGGTHWANLKKLKHFHKYFSS